MTTTSRPRHVSRHNGTWIWQVTVLGIPLRSPEHFDDAESAGFSIDLLKTYLRDTFKLDLQASLPAEHFAALSHRHSVDLSNLWPALPPNAQQFVETNRAALDAHRDAQPDEPDYSKFARHAPSMESSPALREWVRASERADADARAFKELDHDSFFLRLRTIQKSFETALKSAHVALRMHADVTNEKLISRRTEIEALIAHLESDQSYVEEFSARLVSQQNEVSSALSKLERPPLT